MNAVERLAQVIGYPEGVPSGARSFVFWVDDGEMRATEADGRLVLAKVLRRGDGEVDLAALAGYAAGRMLKEDAVLAWDAEAAAPLLWQDVSAAAPDDVLARFFEVFATSCEWWTDRADAASASGPRLPEMTIRP